MELLESHTAAETPPAGRELAELAREEHTLRERAERAAADLARMVAHESRRADEERQRRRKAELTAASMAALVAHENARAAAAEQRLRELGAAS